MFLHTQGVVDQGLVKGFAMMLDSNLDTLWSKVYETYDPSTYFYTHSWDGDGFIIAGETLEPGGGRGTFIMKIDTLGNVLWHNLIHAPWEGVFRNLDVSVVEGGYVWSGAEGVGFETNGIIEYIDTNSTLGFSAFGSGGIRRLSIRHVELNSGIILCAQSILYEEIPGLPTYTYRTIKISELNFENENLDLLNEIEPYPNWINGFPVKMVEADEGVAMMGGLSLNEDGTYFPISFIMKLNASFEQEWYTELFYDDCPSCENILYDMELAPDGGYVMVGTFTDTSIDFNPRTWLVKVDACGDLEWQGCAQPNGLWEPEVLEGSSLEIWPNPVSGNEINIRFPREEVVEKVQIIDGQGRFIPDSKFKVPTAIILNLEFLAPGLYTLIVTTKDGMVCSEKVIIE